MRALTTVPYGQPASICLTDVELRALRAGEVCVRMRATSFNGSDWEYVTGHPGYTRLFGFRRPRFSTYGSDVAGEVVAVGPKVEGLAPGDRVFGDVLGEFGALAQRAVVPAKHLQPMPEGLDHAEAACLCQSGAIAWHAMHFRGGPAAGARVLIVGGGGGSGMFLIQLAKRRGCHVTAIDNGAKQEFMRSMGADEVVDFTRTDFEQLDARYDFIVDLVAPHPLHVYRERLDPGGTYVVVGGPVGRMLWTLVAGPFVGLFGGLFGGRRTMRVLAVPQNAGLLDMAKLVVDGELQVVIDRRYPLDQAAEALRWFGQGEACGKVVVEMPGAAGES